MNFVWFFCLCVVLKGLRKILNKLFFIFLLLLTTILTTFFCTFAEKVILCFST